MPSKHDLIELARICLKQARETKNANAIAVLRRMAKEYQRRAVQFERAAAFSGRGGALADQSFRLEGMPVLKLPFKIVVQPQRDDWIGPQGLAGLPRFFCTTESPGLFISVLRKYAREAEFVCNCRKCRKCRKSLPSASLISFLHFLHFLHCIP
jgi:hypothetical protein